MIARALKPVRPLFGVTVLFLSLYACAAERPLRGGDATVAETAPEAPAGDCGAYHDPCPVEPLLVEA